MAVKALQAVQKHRSINLHEHILPNFNLIVRRHSEDMCVEGGVMQFAEGYSIWYGRHAPRVTIGKDVGRVEKLVMS